MEKAIRREGHTAVAAPAVVQSRHPKATRIDFVANPKICTYAARNPRATRVRVDGEVPAPNLDNTRIFDGHPIQIRTNEEVLEPVHVRDRSRHPEVVLRTGLTDDRMHCVQVVRRKYGLPQLPRLPASDVHAARAPNSHPLIQPAVVRKEAQGRALRIARQESSAAILTESPGRGRSSHLDRVGGLAIQQNVAVHMQGRPWAGRADAHVSI